MKEPKDKRTKEYKQWKASKGLGDDIEKVTKATGIKKAVDWFSEKTGIDCGCDKRKELLNKLFPRKQVECLNKDEHDFLNSIKTATRLGSSQNKELFKIYNRVFNDRKQPCNCTGTIKRMYNDLMRLNKEYENQTK